MVRHGTCFLFPVVSLLEIWQHISLCVSLLLSKCSQALPSHSFTGCHGSLPRKQLGALTNALLNVEVSSAFSESVIWSYHSLSLSSTCFLTTAGGELLHQLWTSLVMVILVQAWNRFQKSSLQTCLVHTLCTISLLPSWQFFSLLTVSACSNSTRVREVYLFCSQHYTY